MPVARAARLALAATLAALLGIAVLPVGGATPAAGSTDRRGGGDATVRLVVRIASVSDARAVTAAATRHGARRIGSVRELRALSFQVSSARAERLGARLDRRTDVVSVDVAHRRWLSAEPADPRFGEQRTYLGVIGAVNAWDMGAHGSGSIRIGIIDSGVDVDHPDLAGKVSERHNAVHGGSDVRDVVGHGTATASVAAAATDNGTGVAGVGYDSSILAVKVADVTGRIFTDDLAAGIVWAVDHGATVVNLSLGGPTSDGLERAAVEYAQAHGVLVVAAAGNEASAAKQFPGALPGVIAVGATTPAGANRTSFSSYGRWVDVGAPGRSIVVATPGGGYDTEDGTSFAAPIVAGASALLAAYRPGRTGEQIAEALVSGADNAKLGFAHGLVHLDRSLALLPPGSTPTITSPLPGTPVSGRTTVTASSNAAQVRLSLGDQRTTVSTADGAAGATFDTYGLGGAQTVTATDCSAIDQCSNDRPASIGVIVDNGSPTVTEPAAGRDQRGDSVHVVATAPGGAVRLFLDDRSGVVDASPPYAADLSTADLADGPHSVRAALCRGDGAVCDLAHAATVPITLTRLHPAITRIHPRAISPNRDNRRDRAVVSYQLDRDQTPQLRVRDASGAVVYQRGLGGKAAGQHRVGWAGQRSGGGRVDSGVYTVEVATADGTLGGLTRTDVVVDRRRPRVGDARPSKLHLLPVHDGYHDATRVLARLDEPVRRLDLQVSTFGGRLVRTIAVGGHEAGPVSVRWNGRTAGGATVAAGGYRVRLVGEDRAGNRGQSRSRTVWVSGKRLVRRSGSTTVLARRSLQDSFADDCSQVFRHSRGAHDGWVGYFASGTCASGDAYAAGDHQVRLPAAVRYGTVRVTAYGGHGIRRFPDSARIVYYDRLQNLSDHSFRLAPKVGSHRGPRASAEPLLIRSRLFRWMTITTGTRWYDVDTYRVDFTYFVLR